MIYLGKIWKIDTRKTAFSVETGESYTPQVNSMPYTLTARTIQSACLSKAQYKLQNSQET